MQKKSRGALTLRGSPHRRALPGSVGGYLLSHFRSTIGVVRFNFSVRNGKRWSPHAITTFRLSGVSPALARREAMPPSAAARGTVWLGTAVPALTRKTGTMSGRGTPHSSAAAKRSGPRANWPGGGALCLCSLMKRVRVISTARLRTLPPFHLPPIYVVVSDDPLWRSYLGVGFALRCFQRLSCPDADTRRCAWRHNR